MCRAPRVITMEDMMDALNLNKKSDDDKEKEKSEQLKTRSGGESQLIRRLMFVAECNASESEPRMNELAGLIEV